MTLAVHQVKLSKAGCNKPAAQLLDLWRDVVVHPQRDARKFGILSCSDERPCGNGVLVGMTNFFRHPHLYDLVMEEAAHLHHVMGAGRVDILCAGGSVGAEAYSLAYMADKAGLYDVVRITSVDLSHKFTQIGRMGVYPAQMLPSDKRAGEGLGLFEPLEDGYLKVSARYLKRVEFVGPVSFVDMPKMGVNSDITLSALALAHTHAAYVPSIRAMAQVTRHVMVVDDELSGLMMRGYGFGAKGAMCSDNIKIWRREPFTP